MNNLTNSNGSKENSNENAKNNSLESVVEKTKNSIQLKINKRDTEGIKEELISTIKSIYEEVVIKKNNEYLTLLNYYVENAKKLGLEKIDENLTIDDITKFLSNNQKNLLLESQKEEIIYEINLYSQEYFNEKKAIFGDIILLYLIKAKIMKININHPLINKKIEQVLSNNSDNLTIDKINEQIGKKLLEQPNNYTIEKINDLIKQKKSKEVCESIHKNYNELKEGKSETSFFTATDSINMGFVETEKEFTEKNQFLQSKIEKAKNLGINNIYDFIDGYGENTNIKEKKKLPLKKIEKEISKIEKKINKSENGQNIFSKFLSFFQRRLFKSS